MIRILLALIIAGGTLGIISFLCSRRAKRPTSEPEFQRLSGPGWSLLPLETKGVLTAVDRSDASVNPKTDIAVPQSKKDVN